MEVEFQYSKYWSSHQLILALVEGVKLNSNSLNCGCHLMKMTITMNSRMHWSLIRSVSAEERTRGKKRSILLGIVK